MLDANKVLEEARKEVADEMAVEAKKKIKAKMKEIATTETILANQRRELDDLITKIGEGNV